MSKKKNPAAKKQSQKPKVPDVVPGPAKDDAAIKLPLAIIRIGENIRGDAANDIEGLAQSIRAHGLLNPLTVTKRDGKFVLVAGERRYRALLLLKETHAPVRFVHVTDKEAKTIQVLENIQRRDLDGVEEIRGVAQLLPFFDGNQSALARSIGRDQTYVNRCVRAEKVLEQLGYATSHSSLTKSMLFELADSKNPKELLSQLEVGGVKSVKEAREKSGPLPGGRFVDGAISLKNTAANGKFVLKINFDPERTPAETRARILETLKGLVAKLESGAFEEQQ